MKHTVHHVYLHEYTQYEHGILHIFTSSSDGEMPVPWQEPEIPVILLPSVGSAYEQECQLPAFVRPSIGLSAGSYPCDPAVFLGGVEHETFNSGLTPTPECLSRTLN